METQTGMERELIWLWDAGKRTSTMLSINWSDVWKMVESIKVPLIVIGVALALASIVSLAVEEQSDDLLPGRPPQRWLHHER